MLKRTPQEKKALSYEKDTRNTYGKNVKASRKLIPLRKAGVNRTFRRKVNDILRQAAENYDARQIEIVESKAASVKKSNWKKSPDTPLGVVVEGKLDRRKEYESNSGKQQGFIFEARVKNWQEAKGKWTAETWGVKESLVQAVTREKAIAKSKRIAGAYFLELIGKGKMLDTDGDYLSIEIC